MTLQHDSCDELFGLTGTFPRPGWVVLDAARDHRFTGELVFETSPRVRVYLDRGQIYLAERISDPSIGARLVDAGALTAVQLERGAVRIGEIEHLGRLFDRVPTLDRHTVIVTAELMTEECVGWLAAQRVADVSGRPYRHHESGIHQWNGMLGRLDLAPGAPLPAPTADTRPVSVEPPADGLRRLPRTEPLLDGLIEWDEPAWLDGSELERELGEPVPDPTDPCADEASTDEASTDEASTDEASTDEGNTDEAAPVAGDGEPESDDWVDRLASDGLPDADPLSAAKPLRRLPVEPVDRFELVWPSGEIDEEFGGVDSVVGGGHDPDADRVGATARLARSAPDPSPEESASATGEPSQPRPSDDGDDDGEPDEVVLAVRRAVASIEVGSLATRRRLVGGSGQLGIAAPPVRRPEEAPADPGRVPEPGRVAVRSGRNDWSRRTVTRSVFDEPVAEPDVAEPEPVGDSDDHGERRAGALRRLISSLRR